MAVTRNSEGQAEGLKKQKMIQQNSLCSCWKGEPKSQLDCKRTTVQQAFQADAL